MLLGALGALGAELPEVPQVLEVVQWHWTDRVCAMVRRRSRLEKRRQQVERARICLSRGAAPGVTDGAASVDPQRCSHHSSLVSSRDRLTE